MEPGIGLAVGLGPELRMLKRHGGNETALDRARERSIYATVYSRDASVCWHCAGWR